MRLPTERNGRKKKTGVAKKRNSCVGHRNWRRRHGPNGWKKIPCMITEGRRARGKWGRGPRGWKKVGQSPS